MKQYRIKNCPAILKTSLDWCCWYNNNSGKVACKDILSCPIKDLFNDIKQRRAEHIELRNRQTTPETTMYEQCIINEDSIIMAKMIEQFESEEV